jgi:hypothetical protein
MFVRNSREEAALKAEAKKNLPVQPVDPREQYRYLAPVTRSRSTLTDAPAEFGIAATILINLLINIAIIGLCIWAIAFGITDIANVGVNNWAVAWIIIGIIGLIFTLGGSRRR